MMINYKKIIIYVVFTERTNNIITNKIILKMAYLVFPKKYFLWQ